MASEATHMLKNTEPSWRNDWAARLDALINDLGLPVTGEPAVWWRNAVQPQARHPSGPFTKVGTTSNA